MSLKKEEDRQQKKYEFNANILEKALRISPIIISIFSLFVAAFSLYFTYLQQQRLENERMTPYKVAVYQKRLDSYNNISPYFIKIRAFANEISVIASIGTLIWFKQNEGISNKIQLPSKTCKGAYDEYVQFYQNLKNDFDKNASIWGSIPASYILNVHQEFRNVGDQYAKYCGNDSVIEIDENARKTMMDTTGVSVYKLRSSVDKLELYLNQEIGLDSTTISGQPKAKMGDAVLIQR